METPVFFIKANGVDITAKLANLGISMTVTDNEGINADSLEIGIDDKDGLVDTPKAGAVLQAIGGYKGRLRDFGRFSVDSVNLTGWPQRIVISAKSVAAKSLAKQRQTLAFKPANFPTYGAILEHIAGMVGIAPAIHSTIAQIENIYEAMADETGTQFILRLCDKLGATISIKDQRLVAVPKGGGQSASGKSLGSITVTRPGNLLSYSATWDDNQAYSSVAASYYDRGKNEKKTEVCTVENPRGDPQAWNGLPVWNIREPYENQAAAKRAAKAKAADIQRAQGSATFEINGDPFALAEATAIVSGARKDVNGNWRVKSASHSFSATSPYTTTLSCDVPESGASG
jgi:phage protein D